MWNVLIRSNATQQSTRVMPSSTVSTVQMNRIAVSLNRNTTPYCALVMNIWYFLVWHYSNPNPNPIKGGKRDNLKWDRHVNEIIKKCNRRLYVLLCLRSHNLPVNDLLAIYKGYVRPFLDYCVTLFNGNLTKEQVNKLERFQKRVCRIISGKNYSIEDALTL